MTTDRERDHSRVKLYVIDQQLVLMVFRAFRQKGGKIAVPRPLNIPETALIQGVHYLHDRRAFGLIVQDQSFPQVEPCAMLESHDWAQEMDFLDVAGDDPGRIPFSVTEDFVARIAWGAYRDAVGVKSWDGSLLPEWDVLKKDESKQTIVQGWIAVAQALREAGVLV